MYLALMAVLRLLFIACSRFLVRTHALRQVEIVTLGVVTNATTISLHYLGPSFDLAASFFREDHRRHFNLTHTYLVNESFSSDCATLTSQTSFVMSEWYYKTRTKADVYAFIVPSMVVPLIVFGIRDSVQDEVFLQCVRSLLR